MLKSLSALGNCISALADLANGKKVLVPYRNSKLVSVYMYYNRVNPRLVVEIDLVLEL